MTVHALPRFIAPRRPAVRLVALVDTVALWFERASQRHALEALDDRQLRDIGISRADAAREAAKPFWLP